MNNSTTSTVSDATAKLGLLDFDKIKKLLKQRPNIIAIDCQKVFFPYRICQYLPKNTVIISSDLAKALNLQPAIPEKGG